MTRLLGLVVFVAALWAAVELHTEGVDGAFGGVFAQAASEPTARSRRAASAFQRAWDSSELRVDRALAAEGGEPETHDR